MESLPFKGDLGAGGVFTTLVLFSATMTAILQSLPIV